MLLGKLKLVSTGSNAGHHCCAGAKIASEKSLCQGIFDETLDSSTQRSGPELLARSVIDQEITGRGRELQINSLGVDLAPRGGQE